MRKALGPLLWQLLRTQNCSVISQAARTSVLAFASGTTGDGVRRNLAGVGAATASSIGSKKFTRTKKRGAASTQSLYGYTSAHARTVLPMLKRPSSETKMACTNGAAS